MSVDMYFHIQNSNITIFHCLPHVTIRITIQMFLQCAKKGNVSTCKVLLTLLLPAPSAGAPRAIYSSQITSHRSPC